MRADRAFALVIGLALVSSAILVALLARIVPHAAHVLLRGPDDVVDAVTLLLLVLATCGIALGMGSLFRQLFLTLTLLRSLIARRTATPSRVRSLAHDLGLDGRIDVVVNRAARSDVTASDVERVLGRVPLGVIPADGRIATAQQRGELVPFRGRVGKQLTRIADALLEERLS